MNKRPVGRPKKPKTNATDHSRHAGQVNFASSEPPSLLDDQKMGKLAGCCISSSDQNYVSSSSTNSRQPNKHQSPQLLNNNREPLMALNGHHQPTTTVQGQPAIPPIKVTLLPRELIKYKGSPSVQSLGATSATTLSNQGLVSVLEGEAIDPDDQGVIDLVTPRREDSLQSSINDSLDASLAQASQVHCPTATKKSRCDEESQDEEMEKPWTCSLPKVAVSFKDYPETLMIWQQFQSFERDVVELMDDLMDTGESTLPSSARVLFKGGAAVFYCNDDEESKNRLTRMLLEGDFLQSRNLKILEDDEIPGSVKMVGIFVNAKEHEKALKMLGLQNENLNTTRWIVNSVRKEDWGLELLLEIDRGSFEFLKTCEFCLPFAVGHAYFKGPKDMWNDRCEEFLLCKQILEQSAVQYPSSKDRFKQLWIQRRSVLTQESKKSKDEASASNNIV